MATAPLNDAPILADGSRKLTVDWQPYDLIAHSKLWFTISYVLLAICLLYMGLNQMKYGAPFRMGIDFTGGTLISDTYEGAAAEKLSAVRAEEIVREIDDQAPTVQISEGANGQKTLLIRASAALAGEEGREKLQELTSRLETEFGESIPESHSISEVSATISGELINKALLGLFWGNLLVFLYVTMRMRLDFAVFGILALLHDIMVTVGFMAIASYHWGWEVNSWFVAVVLTIVGFSINDTIVIYDRIRENLQLYPNAHFPGLVNFSLIQTLTRSVYTALTVWLVLIAMIVGQNLMGSAGGLLEFNSVMLAGMVSGTYSSIFIAAQALVVYYRKRELRGDAGFEVNASIEEQLDIDPALPKRESPVIAQVHRVDAEGDSGQAEGNGTAGPKTIKGSDILGKARPGATTGVPGAAKPKKKRW